MTVNFNDNTLLTITDTILVFEEHCLLHFHLFSFLGLVFNLGKEVHIVAVGIGRKINTKPLELIAGKNGAVFNVASFQKLQEEIDKIKSSVCSGTLSFNFGVKETSCLQSRLSVRLSLSSFDSLFSFFSLL